MSTETKKITSFADFKRELNTSLIKSASKRTLPMIAASTALGVAGVAGRIASATKGHDVSYALGARPMTPRRHVQNGVGIAFGTLGLALNVRELVVRRNQPSGSYGQQNADTTELVSTLIAGVAIGGVAIRELVRGKSTLRSYPTSKYGRALMAASLLNLGASMALSGYELYRRRDQWLPELQEHAQTARVMAPVVVSQVKAKVTGKEPESLSMEEDALERLLATVLKQGGSMNANPGKIDFDAIFEEARRQQQG